MQTKITWHGHSNFQISCDGISVLIDPFFTDNPVCTTKWHEIEKPDLILVTHGGACHGDHTGQTIEIATHFDAQVACIVELASQFKVNGLSSNNVLNTIGFNLGGTLKYKGIEVTMTQAFHSSGATLPVGYVVKMPNGFTFYHAGDTALFGDMALIAKLHPLDLALLPIGDIFTMDSKQAAYATKLLEPKNVIAMHYGTFPVLTQDDSEFASQLKKLKVTSKLHTLKANSSIVF